MIFFSVLKINKKIKWKNRVLHIDRKRGREQKQIDDEAR